jgi:hypothetical protein
MSAVCLSVRLSRAGTVHLHASAGAPRRDRTYMSIAAEVASDAWKGEPWRWPGPAWGNPIYRVLNSMA